jgi:hypothetical protein
MKPSVAASSALRLSDIDALVKYRFLAMFPKPWPGPIYQVKLQVRNHFR